MKNTNKTVAIILCVVFGVTLILGISIFSLLIYNAVNNVSGEEYEKL